MTTPRPAGTDDPAAIADVYLRSRRQDVAMAPLSHTETEVRRWIREVVVASGRVVVVGRPVVGFAASSTGDDGAGWLDHLYVDPGHTGRGLGARLLASALDGLPRPVRLYTFAANAGARRFYERHGFVAVAFGDGSGNEEGVPDVRYELG